MFITMDACNTGECPAGFHHKFSSCRDEALWDMACESDDSTGSVEWSVWAARVVVETAEPRKLPNTDAFVLVLEGFYLITTNDQGFVYVDAYDTEAQLNARFDGIDTAYAEWCDVD